MRKVCLLLVVQYCLQVRPVSSRSEYFALSYTTNVKTTTNDRFMTNPARHMWLE